MLRTRLRLAATPLSKAIAGPFTGAQCPPDVKKFGNFRVFYDQDTFCWVVMDAVEGSANSVGTPFINDFKKVLNEVELSIAQNKAQVVILTSSKSTFCVGADLKEFAPKTDVAEIEAKIDEAHTVANKWMGLPVPTVAAINGTALGGGLEIALLCDYRVCSDDDEKVQLGLPEIQLGVIPGLGGTVRVPKLIGLAASLQNILAGKSMRPSKAKKLGLVDGLVGGVDRFEGENRFLKGARAFAGKKVDKKRRPKRRVGWMDWFLESTPIGRYLVADQTLKGLNKNAKNYLAPWKAFESIMNATRKGVSERKALEFEAKTFAQLCASAEAKNLMSVYFLTDNAKKLSAQPSFASSDVKEVKGVGVVGAGVMGSGVVQFMAAKGFDVYMNDISEEQRQKGKEFCDKEFKGMLKKKRVTEEKYNKLVKRVTVGEDPQPLKTSTVVVEAAVEVMEIKKKMLAAFEEKGIIHKDNYFATNTSSLSLTEIAKDSKFPENVVGMHFFNPVAKMPLVEVIKGEKTSKEAIATIYKLALDTGKFPVVVGDCPGFLVNRILGAYMTETGRLLSEGADPQKVDKALLKFGMPMGPFRLLDEVGLDVAAHVAPVLMNGLGKTRFTINEKIELLVQKGLLGKKNGKGFYTYDQKSGKKTGFNSAAMTENGITTSSSFNYDDVVDRCVLVMANEAVFILDEKIADSPADVDLGMIFGTGFAPFRGGLMNYVDQRGVGEVVKKLQEMEKKYGPRFAPHPTLVKMAADGTKFFPDRPNVRYTDPTVYKPKFSIW